jgi:hypothetical protein
MCATSCPSKPWDTIRKCEPVKKTPLVPGKWTTSKGLTVELRHIGSGSVAVIADTQYGITAGSARELGEFFIECANQMEGKS